LDSVEIIDNDDFDVSEDDIKSIMFNAKTLNAKKAPVSRSGKKAKSKTKRSVGRPKKSETKEPKKRGRPKKEVEKTKRSVGRPKKSETKEPKKRGRPKKG
jgi:hypothetical protein